jgi:hypothetical protein
MSKRAAPPAVAKRAKLAADAAAWAANVLSSVLIIFVNKALMGSAGYGFAFGERDKNGQGLARGNVRGERESRARGRGRLSVLLTRACVLAPA